jgi:hypothetical protein
MSDNPRQRLRKQTSNKNLARLVLHRLVTVSVSTQQQWNSCRKKE